MRTTKPQGTYLTLAGAMCAFFGVVLPGCGVVPNNAEVAEIRSKLADLEVQNIAHGIDIAVLQRQQVTSSSGTIGEYAHLDPAATGYLLLQTDVGPLLVSVEGTTSFADGTLVKLQIGNITAATLTGGEVGIRYGTRMPEDLNTVGAWAESLNAKTQQLTVDLRPGTWNTVEVPLAAIKPEELGYLAVSLSINTVTLRR